VNQYAKEISSQVEAKSSLKQTAPLAPPSSATALKQVESTQPQSAQQGPKRGDQPDSDSNSDVDHKYADKAEDLPPPPPEAPVAAVAKPNEETKEPPPPPEETGQGK
jgi:hypothetical protein